MCVPGLGQRSLLLGLGHSDNGCGLPSGSCAGPPLWQLCCCDGGFARDGEPWRNQGPSSHVCAVRNGSSRAGECRCFGDGMAVSNACISRRKGLVLPMHAYLIAYSIAHCGPLALAEPPQSQNQSPSA